MELAGHRPWGWAFGDLIGVGLPRPGWLFLPGKEGHPQEAGVQETQGIGRHAVLQGVIPTASLRPYRPEGRNPAGRSGSTSPCREMITVWTGTWVRAWR